MITIARRLTVGALSLLLVHTCLIAMASPLLEDEMNADETEILSIISNVASDWNTGNYKGLKAHWDQTDTSPIYLAEEADQIMTSWSQVETYWSASEQWIDWIHVEYSNQYVKRVDATNAMVTFDLRFDLKLNDRPRPIGGDNRAVVSLRMTDGDWKIHSWVEAPLSAMSYVRKLYEMNVRDDLPNRSPTKSTE